MERVPVPQGAEVVAAADGAPNHQDAAPNAGAGLGMMPHAALGVTPNCAGNTVHDGGDAVAEIMPAHALGVAPEDAGNAVYDEAGSAGMMPHAALGVAPDGADNSLHGGAGVVGMMPAHALGVAPAAGGNGADGGAPVAEMMVVVPAFDLGDIETVLRKEPLLLKRQGPGSLILF